MKIWINDSCPCRLGITKNKAGVIILDKWMEKCQIHKDILDENLLGIVLDHNHSFTEREDTQAEFSRIKQLGSTVKNVKLSQKNSTD